MSLSSSSFSSSSTSATLAAYALFRPSNNKIKDGIICVAHSFTAAGRAGPMLINVHNPRTHNLRSCKLQEKITHLVFANCRNKSSLKFYII